MLYYLFYQLLYERYRTQYPILRALNVFQYVTFRTAYATITALMISLVCGPFVIRKLREFKFGQEIREDGPVHHRRELSRPVPRRPQGRARDRRPLRGSRVAQEGRPDP